MNAFSSPIARAFGQHPRPHPHTRRPSLTAGHGLMPPIHGGPGLGGPPIHPPGLTTGGEGGGASWGQDVHHDTSLPLWLMAGLHNLPPTGGGGGRLPPVHPPPDPLDGGGGQTMPPNHIPPGLTSPPMHKIEPIFGGGGGTMPPVPMPPSPRRRPGLAAALSRGPAY